MPLIELTDCTVSLSERKVFWGEEVRPLTAKEAELLAYLVAHPHQEVSRDVLFRDVWGQRSRTQSRTVDTTVYHLRNKVEADPARPRHLLTVHGRGYRFVPRMEAPREGVAPKMSLPPSPAAGPRATLPTLVGRDEEQRLLRSLWQLSSTGRTQLAALIGEAGIGKTSLCQDLLEWAGQRQVHTAATACYAMEGRLGFGPVVSLLRNCPPLDLALVWQRELARWMPGLVATDIEAPPPEPLVTPWQRQRLFEALARAVLSRQPLILLVDDLQWCDSDSLEWLHFLLHFQANARLLVVTTIQSEELLPAHPLSIFLATLQREQRLTRLEISPLDLQATVQLANALSGGTVDPELAGRLFLETQGNPLFVVETVQAGFLTGGGHLAGSLPATREAMLQQRFSVLSPGAIVLAELTAVSASGARLEVLAAASAMSQADLLTGLAELQQRKILRENAEGIFEFTHARLAEFTRARVTSSIRKLRHLQVAQALEHAAPGGEGTACGQVATHYEEAGLPDRALPLYLKAAELARARYAHGEAQALFGKALSLLKSRPDPEMNWRALSGRQQLFMFSGSREEAESNLEAMERLGKAQRRPAWLAAVRCDQALLAYRRMDAHSALSLAGEALELAREADTVELEAQALYLTAVARVSARAELEEAVTNLKEALSIVRRHSLASKEGVVLNGLAYLYIMMGANDEAKATIDALLQLARQRNDRLLEADAHLRLGELFASELDFFAAIPPLEATLRLSREIQHRVKELVTRLALCAAQIQVRHFDAALASFESAIEMCGQQGIFQEEVVYRVNQAWAYTHLGQWEKARKSIELGLETARRVGLRSYEPLLLARYADLEADLGNPQRVLELVEQGLAIEEALRPGSPVLRHIRVQLIVARAKALRMTGATRQGIEELSAVLETYADSRTGSMRKVMIDVRLTLADLHLHLSQPEPAIALLAPLIEALETNLSLHAAPQQAYFLYSRALRMAGEARGAQEALGRARDLVLEAAHRLREASDRRSFLEENPLHREILAAGPPPPPTPSP